MSNKKSTSRKAVFFLANQLKKNGVFASLSTALRVAWKFAKREGLQLIQFTKKNGEVTKRVVTANWSAYNTSKGSRRKPEGLNIFVDFVKIMTGAKSNTISCYSYQTL